MQRMPEGVPRRVVLIASSRSAESLCAQLALAEPSPKILGGFIQGRSPVGVVKLGSLQEFDSARASRLRGHADAVVISLPAGLRGEHLRIRRVLREARLPMVETPAIEDLLDLARVDDASPIERARRVDLAGLIERSPHAIDRQRVAGLLNGRCVAISGAGGSIGSELALQCASFQPSLLVLMERSENALFEIDRLIERRFPEIPRRALLHDVTDEAGTRRHLRESGAQVVYHAAAHKHVPLMEEHPADAVRNNVFGTRSIAEASLLAGAERFVLISSDKAVRPSSIMGATKRLAELDVQALHERAREVGGRTRFAMVRFGNVLGSAGSVIPIWSAQLAEGGPVTITDPRMTRYFMTIPEAAMLVLQASALGEVPGAPVYVLDMGEPIRILDLAMRFVRAHGFEPVLLPGSSHEPKHSPGTIPIVVTGIRPGEKLHEALAYDEEQLRPTPHPGINAWVEQGLRIDADAMIADLRAACASGDRAIILSAIRRHVAMQENSPLPVLKAG